MRIAWELRRRLGSRVPAEASTTWLLALASVGVVVGHTLAYWLVAPDDGERQALLAETGHAYWHAAVAASLIAGGWALAGHLVAQFRGARWAAVPTRAQAGWSTRLAVAQVAVFTLMEVAERVAAGAPVVSLFGQRLFVVGVVAQVAIAFGLARVVAWLGRAAASVGRRLAVPTWPAPRRTSRWAYVNAHPSWSRPRTAWAIRGPPWMSLSFL